MRVVRRAVSWVRSLFGKAVGRFRGSEPQPQAEAREPAPPPDEHDRWLPIPPAVTILEHGVPVVKVGIRSTSGAQLLQTHACLLTHPNGQTYHTHVDTPATAETFSFNYPDDFDDAAPPVTGLYEIAWFRGRDRLRREIVRHAETITIA